MKGFGNQRRLLPLGSEDYGVDRHKQALYLFKLSLNQLPMQHAAEKTAAHTAWGAAS